MKLFILLSFLALINLGCSSPGGLNPKFDGRVHILNLGPDYFDSSPSASKKYQAMCLNGISKACLKVGAYYLSVKNRLGAYKYFQIACNLNDGKGCLGSGDYERHHGMILMAKDLLSKGCQYKSGDSCYSLAELKYPVEDKNEDKDQLYQISCDLKSDAGCSRLGEYFYEEGNLEKAMVYFTRACELGNSLGCYNAGVAYYDDEREYESKKLLEQACRLGNSNGCYQISRYYCGEKKWDEAYSALELAFENGYDKWETIEFDKSFDELRKRDIFNELVDRYFLDGVRVK